MKKTGAGFCLHSHSSWYRPAGFFAGMPSGAQHSLCGVGQGCFGAVGFLPFLGTGGVSPERREHKPLPFFPMKRVKRGVICTSLNGMISGDCTALGRICFIIVVLKPEELQSWECER